MAGGELLVGEELLHLEGKREKTDRVRDVGSGHADPVGELLLLQPELVQELSEGLAKLDRVEVLAVDVLDEGFSEQVGVIRIPQDDGHGGQPGQLGGTEPPLPRDDFVALTRPAHDDRLQDPDLADRRRQLLQASRRRTGSSAASGWGRSRPRAPRGVPVLVSPASGAPGISAESPRPRPPRLDINRLPCGTCASAASGPCSSSNVAPMSAIPSRCSLAAGPRLVALLRPPGCRSRSSRRSPRPDVAGSSPGGAGLEGGLTLGSGCGGGSSHSSSSVEWRDAALAVRGWASGLGGSVPRPRGSSSGLGHGRSRSRGLRFGDQAVCHASGSSSALSQRRRLGDGRHSATSSASILAVGAGSSSSTVTTLSIGAITATGSRRSAASECPAAAGARPHARAGDRPRRPWTWRRRR